MIRPAAALAIAVLALPAGCSSVTYDRIGKGTFKGRLDVEWVEPNHFIFRPHPGDPLTYTTAANDKIEPGTMYTDGGSIPRVFWGLPMLGPWDFAPGYIIHDWLFVQHHCKSAGWEKIDFPRSAQILAEAIKTQMVKSGKEDPPVLAAIYEAVKSPVAEQLWNDGKCDPPPPEAQLKTSAEGRPLKSVPIMTISF